MVSAASPLAGDDGLGTPFGPRQADAPASRVQSEWASPLPASSAQPYTLPSSGPWPTTDYSVFNEITLLRPVVSVDVVGATQEK